MKKYKGFVLMADKEIIQIFHRDPRKDELGKSMLKISKLMCQVTDRKYVFKAFTFSV